MVCACLSSSAAEYNERLANISTRAQVGPGSNIAIVGFVIGPGPTKTVLIRAAGPGLSQFLTGVVSDPKIDLYDSNGTRVLGNDNWGSTVAPAGTAASSTFTSVGAFGFTAGSKDAALVATLSPGGYTAMVSGVGTASGIALLEVYDITGSARLVNLSSRAQVGTGAGVLVSGLVISPGGGARKILVRAAGPTLTAHNVSGVLADPAIAVYDGNNIQIASNDNWDSSNGAALAAAFVQSGAFDFPAGSKDAALLIDLPPGSSYTVQVSGVGNTTGTALIEVYDVTPSSATTINLAATTATTDTKGAAPGSVTFTRSGATGSALTVYYTLGGSAINGSDYTSLPGSITIPAGAASATVSIAARTDNAGTAINKDVTVQLANGPGYSIGSAGTAAVTIFFNPGTLYLSSLRALSTATTSTAYGTATIQLSGDNSFAVVSVSLSNLSSPETAVYLRLGNGADVGAELLRLPTGQVSGMTWTFKAAGTYSVADIVQAIKNGNVYLDIQTASYPTGELRGTFLQTSGSSTFTAPTAAPAISTTALSAADAARFLIQATFGPTKAEVDALTGKTQTDLRTWIDRQIAVTPSLHLDAVDADFKAFATGDNPQYSQSNRQAAWWKLSLTAPDQLRQRVAFALSELFVVSDVNGTLSGNARGMANYYDLLVNGAFGNFRTLLEQVTLSPVMGVYLSSLRNAKATYDKSGALLTSADENYAREVMQLFTIGLSQLQPDGTLKLDALGMPLPTYDQTTITQVAKVFTGWSFAADTSVASNFRGAAANYLSPMVLYPTYHDDTAKTVVGGAVIPANQGGAKDLKDMLDTLFNHPNTAPFVARALIQRLVTSNPSPGYVYRVAQVFANNGSGVRGDLGAVMKAILLDYEARTASVAATASFGKLKEPLLRVSGVLRAFGAAANNGRYAYLNPEGNLAEASLRSPTVFNFFEPAYIQPGVLAGNGLYAPEFQILTDTTAISVPNQLWSFIYANRSTTNTADATLGLTLDSLTPLARTPAALVEQTNLLLAGGGLPKAITDRIVAAITAMPNSTSTTVASSDIERVRSAIYLTVSVPQGAIQK